MHLTPLEIRTNHIAAVLEYLVCEMVELAGNAAIDSELISLHPSPHSEPPLTTR
jgi:hypothetical protein